MAGAAPRAPSAPSRATVLYRGRGPSSQQSIHTVHRPPQISRGTSSRPYHHGVRKPSNDARSSFELQYPPEEVNRIPLATRVHPQGRGREVTSLIAPRGLSSPPREFSDPYSYRRLEPTPKAAIIVSNVPLNLTAQEIQEAFSTIGVVIRTEILLNSQGQHTGRVAVVFQRHDSAVDAVRRFDGGDLDGHVIRVFLE